MYFFQPKWLTSWRRCNQPMWRVQRAVQDLQDLQVKTAVLDDLAPLESLVCLEWMEGKDLGVPWALKVGLAAPVTLCSFPFGPFIVYVVASNCWLINLVLYSYHHSSFFSSSSISFFLSGEKGTKGDKGEPGVGERGESGPPGPIGNNQFLKSLLIGWFHST